MLYCYDARTGALRYEARLASGEGFTASTVAGGSQLYFTSEVGDTYVVRPGPELETLATNSLGETVLATPAISEGVLFFRSRHRVTAIAESDRAEPSR